MELRPLGDRVVIQPMEAEEKTESGLFLSRDAQEKPQQGTVIAVGLGKKDEDGDRVPMDVKVGDKVLYGKFGGNEVKLGEDTVLIMREDDIYAIID